MNVYVNEWSMLVTSEPRMAGRTHSRQAGKKFSYFPKRTPTFVVNISGFFPSFWTIGWLYT